MSCLVPLRLAALAPTLAAVMMTAGCSTNQSVPADAVDACPLDTAAFGFWLDGPLVVDARFKVPDSAQPIELKPNCGFYAWGEQMFLWLNSPPPSSYGAGARVFESPVFYDVSPPDAAGRRSFIAHVPGVGRAFPLRTAQRGPHGLAVAIDRAHKLFEFTPAPAGQAAVVRSTDGRAVEVAHASRERGELVLSDRQGGVIAVPHVGAPDIGRDPGAAVHRFKIDGHAVFIDGAMAVVDVEQGEAGGSQVLQAQPTANGSLVYYATLVNDVYAYFLTAAKTKSGPSIFPSTPDGLAAVVAFAKAHGKGDTPFPDAQAMAVEVKTAWVRAAGLADAGQYITTQASVPVYDTSDPDVWKETGHETVQLALIGMHVAGSTFNHSEMVWATFEHDRNAPAATYTYQSATGLKTLAQDTSGDWLFATTGSGGPFNVAHMTFDEPSGQIRASAPFHVGPSDTMRTMPWGTDGTDAKSNTEVIAMNHHVRSMLMPGDVRAHYKMTGATWTVHGEPPEGNMPGVGTPRLANTTMETYQQGAANCFSCHQNPLGSGLDPRGGLSHVFGDDASGLKPLF